MSVFKLSFSKSQRYTRGLYILYFCIEGSEPLYRCYRWRVDTRVIQIQDWYSTVLNRSLSYCKDSQVKWNLSENVLYYRREDLWPELRRKKFNEWYIVRTKLSDISYPRKITVLESCKNVTFYYERSSFWILLILNTLISFFDWWRRENLGKGIEEKVLTVHTGRLRRRLLSFWFHHFY